MPAVPSEGDSSLSLRLLATSIDGLALVTASPVRLFRRLIDEPRHRFGFAHRLNAVLCVWQT